MGLLDGMMGNSIEDPKTQAMAGFIQGLLTPGGLLKGASQGVMNYGGVMQRQKMLQQEMALHDLQQQQTKLGIQTGQMNLDQAKLNLSNMMEYKRRLANLNLGDAQSSASLSMPDQNPGPQISVQASPPTAQQGIEQAAMRPSSAMPVGQVGRTPVTTPVNSTVAYINRLKEEADAAQQSGLFDVADAKLKQVAALTPKVKEIKTQMVGGTPTSVMVMDNGDTRLMDGSPAPKLHFGNTGGKYQGFDEITGAPVGPGMTTTQSPDSAASVGATIRSQNLTDARARDALKIRQFEADPTGMFGVNPNAPKSSGGVSIGSTNGDEFLSSIPKPIADQVKALAEGRMAFPAGFALKSPYWQNMISMVSQYDPSFDAVNYNARSSTRKDFTSGKSAQSLNALNTVLGHVSSLVDAGDKLNNTSVPLVNAPVNWVQSNVLGDPRVKEFNATKQAVSSELERAWRGTGGSEGDLKQWKEQLDSAGSPDQLRGVAGQISELLKSKIDSMANQYQQGMGTTGNGRQFLTPESIKTLDKLQKLKGNPSAGGLNIDADAIAAELARRGH